MNGTMRFASLFLCFKEDVILVLLVKKYESFFENFQRNAFHWKMHFDLQDQYSLQETKFS